MLVDNLTPESQSRATFNEYNFIAENVKCKFLLAVIYTVVHGINTFLSEQSTVGITTQVKENHSQRDFHWWPGGERSGLAVGRPGWRQWKERKGGQQFEKYYNTVISFCP